MPHDDLRDLAGRIERLAAEHPAAPRVWWILTQCALNVRAAAAVADLAAAEATCGNPRPPNRRRFP
jgi:hypothetical protein